MPYMQYLYCEHCGNYAQLDIDPTATIDAYSQDYIKGTRKIVELDPTTFIWDYLMYGCEICGRKYKYTYRDVEKKVREYFSFLAQQTKEYMNEFIEESQIRTENKLDPNHKEKIEERKTIVTQRIKELYTSK